MSDAGEMRALGVSPNPRTFSVLLSAASRGGHGQQALEVFAEMEALGVRPNVRTCNALLHACAAAGMKREAMAAFASMQVRLWLAGRPFRGVRGGGRVRTGSLYISGPCHPPHVGGGWVYS
jgi:pentatricopeptide repeat protein